MYTSIQFRIGADYSNIQNYKCNNDYDYDYSIWNWYNYEYEYNYDYVIDNWPQPWYTGTCTCTCTCIFHLLVCTVLANHMTIWLNCNDMCWSNPITTSIVIVYHPLHYITINY